MAKGIPQPKSTLQSLATARFNANERTMSPRDFRDALTKAKGSVRGIPTEVTQWSNWTP